MAHASDWGIDHDRARVAINFATDLRSSWLAWLAVAVLTVVGYACGRIVDRVGRSDGTQLAGRPEESDPPGHSVADSRGTFLQAGGNITIGGPGHGRAILAGLLALVALVVSVMAIAPSFRPTFLVGEPARGAQNPALSIVGLDLASTVELTRTDYSGGDDKVGVEPVNAAAAKIIVHNNGEQAALIGELRVHISKVWTPETCDGAGRASTSISYDFVLPGDIHRQTFPLRLSRRIDLHVAGKSNDRLAVTTAPIRSRPDARRVLRRREELAVGRGAAIRIRLDGGNCPPGRARVRVLARQRRRRRRQQHRAGDHSGLFDRVMRPAVPPV